MTQKSFKFARNNHLPFYFVSAADGTNVVKVCTISLPTVEQWNLGHIETRRYYREVVLSSEVEKSTSSQ